MERIQLKPAVRVPLELIHRHFRLRQKRVDRELEDAVAEVKCGCTDWNLLAERLTLLKEQSRKWREEERADLHILRTRVDGMLEKQHLEFCCECAIVEWFARIGHASLARQAQAVSSPQCQVHMNTQPISEIDECTASLRRRNTSAALGWIQANASRLRRMGSSIEFQLRKREFVELVRRKELSPALELASLHLAPAAKAASDDTGDVSRNCMQQLQQVMSMLAFPNPASCGVSEIEKLFDDASWGDLALDFATAAFSALGFHRHPMLMSMLSIGLAALKTTACGTAGATYGLQQNACHSNGMVRLCPLCSVDFFACSAAATPMLKRSHTLILCPILRCPTTDRNPPLALPNGYVYAAQTVEVMTSDDKSHVLCPLTGSMFAATEVRKVYIV
jgi:macrophage erythroblast attacher